MFIVLSYVIGEKFPRDDRRVPKDSLGTREYKFPKINLRNLKFSLKVQKKKKTP